MRRCIRPGPMNHLRSPCNNAHPDHGADYGMRCGDREVPVRGKHTQSEAANRADKSPSQTSIGSPMAVWSTIPLRMVRAT